MQATGLEGSWWVPQYWLVTLSLLVYLHLKGNHVKFKFSGAKESDSEGEMTGLKLVFLYERLP